jgi:predicted RND superfamily exporter protein
VSHLFIYFARRPALSAALLIIPTLISLYFLPQLQSDPSFDRLLIEDDPERIVYEEVIEEFGDDNSILLYFEGEALLSRNSLLKIRQFVWDLEEIEEVQKVDSLFTTPHFIGVDGLLSTTAALEDIPESQEEIDKIIDSTVKNPMIATRLIAVDKSSIVVNMQIASNKRPLKDISIQFNQMLGKLGLNAKRNFQTGIPSIQLFTFREMRESQRTLLPIMVLAISVFIFLGSKSVHASIIPIVVVLLGLIWTIAFMVFAKIPLQLLVSSIPSITFILATTEIVHIMTSYLHNLKSSPNKISALEEALKETSLPISLTALTTVLGFGAICINQIVMLREFGIVSAFALIASFIITILYTPLHIRLFVKEKIPEVRSIQKDSIFQMAAKLFIKARSYKKTILILLICYTGITGYLAQFVESDNDSINMITPDSKPRKNLAVFEEHFGGINSVFLVLELKEGDFKDPQHLKFLFDLERKLRANKDFYDAESFGSLMAHINNQMKISIGNNPEYSIPENKNLISQYLLSLTGDDYEKYVSSDFKKANITIRHSISSSAKQKKAMDKLHLFLDQNLDPSKISYKISARSILNQRSGATIISAQSKSIIFMILIIFIIMSFLFKDLKMGLAAIPPNLLPILGLFASMSLLGIPLNVGTCIVAAITVGIAIDDTIHFFTRFKDNLNLGHSVDKAINKTIEEETSPIVITSLSLSIGFSFLLISHMVPIKQFGLLSAIVILLAMISDLFVTPYVLSIVGKHLTAQSDQV